MTTRTDPKNISPDSSTVEMVVVSTVDFDEVATALDQAWQTYTANRRRGIGQMLTALTPVLAATDPKGRRGHRQMMSELLSGLIDLDRGLQPLLLTKAKVGHRPQQSMATWHTRACAACIADLLEATGMGSEEANRTVARVLERYDLQVSRQRGGARPASVIARWRAELTGGRAPSEAEVAYSHLRQQVTGLPAGLLPAEARRAILEPFEKQLREGQLGKGRRENPTIK
jgi:hypothetical protein